MDIKTIEECTARSLEGNMTFPEVVQKLAATGTERYTIDLIGLKILLWQKQRNLHGFFYL